MPALIVPQVARFAVHGTFSGVDIVNVLDMDIRPTGDTTRAEAITDQANIIVSAWADYVCPVVSVYYGAQSVSWVDMDAADGSVGSVTDGTGTDFPAVGGLSDAPAPGNVAIRINKQTVAARGARQGRMYLVGLIESATAAGTPNIIQAANVAGVNAALGDFLPAINQDGGLTGITYGSDLMVVHTKHTGPPDDQVLEYVSKSKVLELVCDPKVSSQRRRLGR